MTPSMGILDRIREDLSDFLRANPGTSEWGKGQDAMVRQLAAVVLEPLPEEEVLRQLRGMASDFRLQYLLSTMSDNFESGRYSIACRVLNLLDGKDSEGQPWPQKEPQTGAQPLSEPVLAIYGPWQLVDGSTWAYREVARKYRSGAQITLEFGQINKVDREAVDKKTRDAADKEFLEAHRR